MLGHTFLRRLARQEQESIAMLVVELGRSAAPEKSDFESETEPVSYSASIAGSHEVQKAFEWALVL